MKRVLSVAALALIFSCTSLTPYVVTGESLKSLGAQFVAASALWDQALDTGVITHEQYQAWKDFIPKFQGAYRPAVDLWDTARKVNDAVLEKKAADVIAALAVELLALYETVQKLSASRIDAGVPLDGGT